MFNFFRRNKNNSIISTYLHDVLQIRDSIKIEKIEQNLLEDKINFPMVTINIKYLLTDDLRPTHIIKDSLMAKGNYIDENSLKRQYNKELIEVATLVNRTVEKIACNITLGNNKWYFPEFILANLSNNALNINEVYLFIASYPDVFDYFFPVPDVLSEEWKKDRIKYKNTTFEEIGRTASRINDAFYEYLEKNKDKIEGEEPIDLLFFYKKYYSDILNKPFLMANITKE